MTHEIETKFLGHLKNKIEALPRDAKGTQIKQEIIFLVSDEVIVVFSQRVKNHIADWGYRATLPIRRGKNCYFSLMPYTQLFSVTAVLEYLNDRKLESQLDMMGCINRCNNFERFLLSEKGNYEYNPRQPNSRCMELIFQQWPLLKDYCDMSDHDYDFLTRQANKTYPHQLTINNFAFYEYIAS